MIHTSINGNVKGVSRIYWIWYWHRLQGYVDLATSWYEIFVMISSYRFKFTSFGSNRQISVIYVHESIPNNKINNEFPTWANGLLANFAWWILQIDYGLTLHQGQIEEKTTLSTILVILLLSNHILFQMKFVLDSLGRLCLLAYL